MESERPRRALLLGLVEVRQPLKQLDEEDRAKMFALCHTASVTGHVEDSGWLGWQERGLMGVEVVLDQEHLHVTSNEVLVSRHSLAEVDAIVAVQGTEGHLVIVGQCQVKGLPLAVVLDMMSHVDARRLEDDVRQRVSRLLPPSVQPSTSKDTVCPPPLPSAPPITDLDLSTSLPYTTCRSVSQHPDQASVHASGSPGPTRIESPSTVVQPSSCSSDLSSPSPLPVKSILTGNFRAKPSVTHMPAPTTLMVTPLRCTFRPPVSHLSISPVSTLPVPNPLVFTPPVSTLPVSTPLVSLRPVSTRPVSTRPVSTPPVPTIPVSNPSMFPRPVSTPPVSALPVSIRPVITWPASTRPASTPPVSTPPVSTQLVSITIVPTSPVSTRPLSKPVLPIRPVSTLTVNSRPVSLSRVSTPLVSTLPVSITSASIPTVSRLPASTPHVPTRPVSFPRVITPLVFTPTVSNTTVSATPVCTPPVSTRPTFTRPVSKPIVPTRPVSFPKVLSSPVSTTPVSIAAVSTTPVSIAAVSTTPMSIAAVSTTPVSIAAVSTTPVSTVVVSTTPVSIAPVCATSVSIAPVPTTPVSIATMSDTPVSIAPVSTTPVSIAEVSTTPASIAPVSNAPMSNTAVSTIPVSTTPVSTTPMSTTSVSTVPISTTSVATNPVPTTPVSTPWVSNQSASTVMVSSSLLSTPLVNAVSPSTLPVSSPPVSTVPAAPQHLRRHSGESSGSLEEDNSNVHEKVEFILGTLNVDESEYLFTPGMKHKQEQDSSSSMEHELSTFLENEHQYLDTLRRIKDARRVVKSELQNLLRRNESLADFHEDLFRDLHQEFPSCSGVARMFLSRKEDLEQYRYYLMNAPQVIHQLGKQTEEVTRQHPTLEEDLKSSWKRLHYYFMTFDKLAKIASTEEQPLVQEVVELLRDMNRQGDSAILIDGVVGAPFSLHTLGSLLLHGLFTIKDSSGVLKTRAKHHVLLFVEMIVITLPKKERYQYKDHLPIRQLNLREANSDEATFVLEFLQGGNKKNRRFTFKSRQQEATDAWVKEITRLHLEYAKEVKRHSKLRYGWQ